MYGRTSLLALLLTGRIRGLPEYRRREGRTAIPLRFAPRQSWFVVFREEMGTTKDAKNAKGRNNFPKMDVMKTLDGLWSVQFDPSWFYPDDGTGGNVRFERLEDWSRHPEEAIRFYSGLATYRTTFEFSGSDPDAALYLDLGVVKNIAQVRLNSRDLGVVWTAPWQVDVTGVIRSGANELEIDVANLWPNRLIGDASLPQDNRRTVTNITGITPASPLMESGLLGPVTLQRAEQRNTRGIGILPVIRRSEPCRQNPTQHIMHSCGMPFTIRAMHRRSPARMRGVWRASDCMRTA